MLTIILFVADAFPVKSRIVMRDPGAFTDDRSAICGDIVISDVSNCTRVVL